MNYTKEEILKVTIKLLEDINYPYDMDEIFISFKEERELARGVNKGKSIKAWVVSIEDNIFETTDFLTISDETGEPLYLQTKHIVREFGKDENGKYYKVLLENEE